MNTQISCLTNPEIVYIASLLDPKDLQSYMLVSKNYHNLVVTTPQLRDKLGIPPRFQFTLTDSSSTLQERKVAIVESVQDAISEEASRTVGKIYFCIATLFPEKRDSLFLKACNIIAKCNDFRLHRDGDPIQANNLALQTTDPGRRIDPQDALDKTIAEETLLDACKEVEKLKSDEEKLKILSEALLHYLKKCDSTKVADIFNKIKEIVSEKIELTSEISEILDHLIDRLKDLDIELALDVATCYGDEIDKTDRVLKLVYGRSGEVEPILVRAATCANDISDDQSFFKAGYFLQIAIEYCKRNMPEKSIPFVQSAKEIAKRTLSYYPGHNTMKYKIFAHVADLSACVPECKIDAKKVAQKVADKMKPGCGDDNIEAIAALQIQFPELANKLLFRCISHRHSFDYEPTCRLLRVATNPDDKIVEAFSINSKMWLTKYPKHNLSRLLSLAVDFHKQHERYHPIARGIFKKAIADARREKGFEALCACADQMAALYPRTAAELYNETGDSTQLLKIAALLPNDALDVIEHVAKKELERKEKRSEDLLLRVIEALQKLAI